MPLEPFLGQIMPFAGSFVPRGWALCNGQLLSIDENALLFALLSTTFGGDGVSTFALPDLQGRAIMGTNFDQDNPLGTIGGTPTVTLTVAQMPSHAHSFNAAVTDGGGRGDTHPEGNVFGTNTLPSGNPTMIFVPAGTEEVNIGIANVGFNKGGAPHTNMQPYLVINYLIAIEGEFPDQASQA
jgi:microcystin-dependent protein